MRGKKQLHQLADNPTFQLSCAGRRSLFSVAITATGSHAPRRRKRIVQVHSQPLFQLTKFCILDITVPRAGFLCSKAPHLKYKLSLSWADQNLLCETNQQMEIFLATSSKMYAPLDLHLVWPISRTLQNSPWIYLCHFRTCCTFVVTRRKPEARIPVFH